MVAARLSSVTQLDKTQIPDNKVKFTTFEETTKVASPTTKEVTPAQIESKPKEVAAPGVGSELSIESLWQGLRLKKDIQLGKISEPTWKEQKHTVSKVTLPVHSKI